MNKYDGLLSKISRQYNIKKGNRESEDDWKMRLIYSICGMMAYASLWDESDEPVSIVHLKQRIRITLGNYMVLYPELGGRLTYDPDELAEEVTNIFMRMGVVYHRPNRIVPSMKREESTDDILFQRGIALGSISRVSGVGFYSMRNGSDNPDKVEAMFGLERENLQVLWQTTLSSASWTSEQKFEYNTEYLRLEPPFSRGYWVNKPDITGRVSILRMGTTGSGLYYLYRYAKSSLEVSPLPQWKVESHNYRALACACLSTYGTLPPIMYSEDGVLIHIKLGYLLPPRELEFLKLYSWPERCAPLPCNFERKLSAEVFAAIKNILYDEGYQFKGGNF